MRNTKMACYFVLPISFFLSFGIAGCADRISFYDQSDANIGISLSGTSATPETAKVGLDFGRQVFAVVPPVCSAGVTDETTSATQREANALLQSVLSQTSNNATTGPRISALDAQFAYTLAALCAEEGKSYEAMSLISNFGVAVEKAKNSKTETGTRNGFASGLAAIVLARNPDMSNAFLGLNLDTEQIGPARD